jgi:hypothetical protein
MPKKKRANNSFLLQRNASSQREWLVCELFRHRQGKVGISAKA